MKLILLILLPVFLMLVYIYYYIATQLGIFDEPNIRSSHRKATIRGGGVLFPIAWIMYELINALPNPWFSAGLLILAVVSFLDDVKPRPIWLRMSVHFFSVGLILVQLNTFIALPLWSLLPLLILMVGIINAFNFMDGINGMTALYGLSILIPITIFSTNLSSALLPYPFLIAAMLAFSWLNVRSQAKCFAGDVGSVSLGYIIIYILVAPWGVTSLFRESSLNLGSGEAVLWPGLLMISVYGIDVVLTILLRIWLGENLLQAHRRHLYQVLVNNWGWSHISVSSVYALLQLVISMLVLMSALSWAIGLVTLLVITYIILYRISVRSNPMLLISYKKNISI
jgi:UDP-N-acetylmuramyl pentapeptide phosphotransferase/UDP-N-acetylglucosamine-1-phosphate transferase